MTTLADLQNLVPAALGTKHMFRLKFLMARATDNGGTLPQELESDFNTLQTALMGHGGSSGIASPSGMDSGAKQSTLEASPPPAPRVVKAVAQLRTALSLPPRGPEHPVIPKPVASSGNGKTEADPPTSVAPPKPAWKPAPKPAPVATPVIDDTPPKFGRRSKPIDMEATHPLSESFRALDKEVFSRARAEATEATMGSDRVQGMKNLLTLKTPPAVKKALDRDLQSFTDRSNAVAEAVARLGPEQRAAYEQDLKAQTMESLFAMSDTCSGASTGGGRAQVAREYYTETFEKVCDPAFRQSCQTSFQKGGILHPLYGGSGTRFMEFNVMLNNGGSKTKRAYEPGVFGKPREEGNEANVRGFVEKTVGDVDGSITTVPGGKDTLANVKAVSSYVEGYLKTKPEDVNPMEVLAKQYQAEISNHSCPNGNGRSGLLNLMATAADLGLPMPLLTKEGTKMIHAMGGQVHPDDNMSPVDAMAAVSQGIDRMIAVQESILAKLAVVDAEETGIAGRAALMALTDAQREIAGKLESLTGKLKGLGDPVADKIAELIASVAVKVSATPGSRSEAEALLSFVTTDETVEATEMENQFGISVDIRGPLVPLLREVVATL